MIIYTNIYIHTHCYLLLLQNYGCKLNGKLKLGPLLSLIILPILLTLASAPLGYFSLKAFVHWVVQPKTNHPLLLEGPLAMCRETAGCTSLLPGEGCGKICILSQSVVCIKLCHPTQTWMNDLQLGAQVALAAKERGLGWRAKY